MTVFALAFKISLLSKVSDPVQIRSEHADPDPKPIENLKPNNVL